MTGKELIDIINSIGADKEIVVEDDSFFREILSITEQDNKIQLSLF